MLLTVWRHGEAVAGSPDLERTLSASGRDDIATGSRSFAAALIRRGLAPPTQLFHSRWVRTAQTAQIICNHLPEGVAVNELAALIPGSSRTGVEASLALAEAARNDGAHLVLVSHQPLVSSLIDSWLGERGEVPSLQPGAFAVLDMPVVAAGCATLCFYAVPPAFSI